MTVDAWDPVQYERFRDERRRPFDDLLALVEPVPGGRVVDLGCGTGELTVELHRRTRAAGTLGVDRSSAMLARAPVEPGVRFERGDIEAWDPGEPVDVVFSNAALQWLPDHPTLLPRLVRHLVPGGQLAVQVPANFDHPTHTVADEVAARRELPPAPGATAVLAPEAYASLLHGAGLRDLVVRLEVYAVALDRTADVVEWTKGTLLTPYRAALDDDAYRDFVDEYRRIVLERLGDPGGERPYLYPFKRILLRARRAALR